MYEVSDQKPAKTNVRASFPPPAADDDEEVYTELNGHTLYTWTEVIKSTHPGSMSHLSSQQRYRLEKAVEEFLSLHLTPAEISQCRALTSNNKPQIAMPENLVETFGDWLDEQMDKNILNKDNIAAWRAQLEGVVPKKGVSYSASTFFDTVYVFR